MRSEKKVTWTQIFIYKTDINKRESKNEENKENKELYHNFSKYSHLTNFTAAKNDSANAKNRSR